MNPSLSNSFEALLTFREICKQRRFDVTVLLCEHERYRAHLRRNHHHEPESYEVESLAEHSHLVLERALSIIDAHGLESVIDAMCSNLAATHAPNLSKEAAIFFKTLFIGAIFYHDAGKINENFQREKMNNTELFTKKIHNTISSEHSILSAFIFSGFAYQLYKTLPKHKERIFCAFALSAFAYPIKRHHGTLYDACAPLFKDEISLKKLIKYTAQWEGELRELKSFMFSREMSDKAVKDYRERFINTKTECFTLFALVKLCFSVLTAADFIATGEFMTGVTVMSAEGVLNDELRERIITGVQAKQRAFEESNATVPDNLNTLRLSLANDTLAALRKSLELNPSQRLFYLEAPTGAGKTHLSLLLAAEILSQRPTTRTMLYVFPFTTLITQTAQTLASTLGVESGKEMAELHSRAPLYAATEAKNAEAKAEIEDELDSKYGSERSTYLEHLFCNYPILLMSHVRFFEALLSNNKERNYLLHRLANSVVIIDEIQSYDPRKWDKIAYALSEYSEAFNITVIVMSATLPKIGQLLNTEAHLYGDRFATLVANKTRYFTAPEFAGRVRFSDKYLEPLSGLQDEEWMQRIAGILVEEADVYSTTSGRGARVLVEVLTKKRAQRLYTFLREQKNNSEGVLFKKLQGYEILHLSGTILEPQRRTIIHNLKKNTMNNVILVATQVIEAGVDVDMDIGFKDMATFDSDEQFAGRVNRNATKSNSIVYLFQTDDAGSIYGKDLRRKAYRTMTQTQRLAILESKDFDRAYSDVLGTLTKQGSDEMSKDSFLNFREMIHKLGYAKVSKEAQLLEDNTVSIFVPLAIPEETVRTYYSEEFLALFPASCREDGFIYGERLWELYTGLIRNTSLKQTNFLAHKEQMKSLSALIAQFTFSLTQSQARELQTFTNTTDEFGFIYLAHYDGIYSLEDGLDYNAVQAESNFL